MCYIQCLFTPHRIRGISHGALEPSKHHAHLLNLRLPRSAAALTILKWIASNALSTPFSRLIARPTRAAFSRITLSVVTFFSADAMSDARKEVAFRPTPSLVTRSALRVSLLRDMLRCRGLSKGAHIETLSRRGCMDIPKVLIPKERLDNRRQSRAQTRTRGARPAVVHRRIDYRR